MKTVVNRLHFVQWITCVGALAAVVLCNTTLAQDAAEGAAEDAAQDVAEDITEDPSGDVATQPAPTTLDTALQADTVLEEEAPAMCPCEETPEEDPNALKLDWVVSAGGAFNTGNTQSWILNAGTDFKLEKNEHVLTANGAFSYGRANLPDDDPDIGLQTTVRQLLLGARYDYFFTEKDAIWAALGYRWDTIANLDTQLRAEAGYLRAFIKEEKHYFAGRIGYSYSYENYTMGFGTPADDDQSIHGLLLALDYENMLNDNVTFLTGITTIFNLNKLDTPAPADPFEDVRVFWHAGLIAKLFEKLSAEIRFNLLYDRIPAAAKKVDTTTTFSLIYTLL